MSFLKVLIKNLFAGPSTEAFPFAEAPTPERLRGKVAFDAATCTLCRACEHVCPAGAIRFTEEAGGLRYAIWHNTCVTCGLCAHYCSTKAIRVTNDWHLSHLQEEKFTIEDDFVPFARCESCGTEMQPVPNALARKTYQGVSRRTDRLLRLCLDCRRSASYSGEIR